MLSPNEFSVGSLADARPLSLILPRTEYEVPIIVGGRHEEPVAVFLGGPHEFCSLSCKDNTNWKGLIIYDVSIEVDENSLFDAGGQSAPLGALVRLNRSLVIVAAQKNAFSRPFHVDVICDLPPVEKSELAGFGRWQIVLGSGCSKRMLRTVPHCKA